MTERSRPSQLQLSRASLLLVAVDALEGFGVPPEAILNRAGVSPRWLEAKPDMLMPLSSLYRFLEVAGGEIAGIGAHLPGRMIALAGGFGRSVRSASTVFDALSRFVAHVPSLGGVHEHRLIPDAARRGVWLARSGPLAVEGAVAQTELIALRFVVEIVRLAAGPGWKPQALRFRSREEAESILDAIPVFKGVPAATGAEWGGVCVSQTVLHLAMPPFEGPSIADLASNPSEGPATGFEPALREILVSYGDLGMNLALRDVAGTLRVHPRSLQRRLEAEGTTFRSVADQARCLRARQLILGTAGSLAEIAAEIGYSDQANFTRAFRRWTGSTPGALRREACRGARSVARPDPSRGAGDQRSAA